MKSSVGRLEAPVAAVIEIDALNIKIGQKRLERVIQNLVLSCCENATPLRYREQLFRNGESGGITNHRVSLVLQLQAADPHHHEFIEIGTRDREKLGSFQQRQRRIRGLVEHALIEFQPAQLTINESVAGKLRNGSR